MAQVPPQRAQDAFDVNPEELIGKLSHDLERAIEFAEECRWYLPEVAAEAEALAADAMALFTRSVRTLRARSDDALSGAPVVAGPDPG